MNETPTPSVDSAAFQKVWRRVMPEDRHDCPFTVDTPTAPAATTVPAVAPPSPTSPPVPIPAIQAPVQMPDRALTMPQACLGEGSRTALPELEGLLAQTNDAARIYRALARRARGTRGFLSSLAASKEGQVRRLAAARFLILGEAFVFPPTVFPRTATLPLALRERYQAEQRSALDFLSAAQRTTDPCLIQLYRDLADENQVHAGQIRERLEQR